MPIITKSSLFYSFFFQSHLKERRSATPPHYDKNNSVPFFLRLALRSFLNHSYKLLLARNFKAKLGAL